ncbi:hypothetical protein QL285_031504 [Trifolium repens]|nr:hypothetical protein QL285_031504 [Trifolium repens]
MFVLLLVLLALTLSCLTVSKSEPMFKDNVTSPFPPPPLPPKIDVNFYFNVTLKIALSVGVGAAATTLAVIGWCIHRRRRNFTSIQESGEVELGNQV